MGLNKLKSTALSKGQKLKVRDDGSYKELNPIERKDDKTGAKMKVHIVRQGENLWDIANRYNTTTEKLMALNKMPNEKIDLFQELIIEIIK
jgi:LysM repeat protein